MTFPDWWPRLHDAVLAARTSDFTRMTTPAEGARPSAVLVLFGEHAAGDPDILLLQRAATMRNHAGQPAFPGGAADPGETSAVQTALREAAEEVGLDPASVVTDVEMPQLFIPVSNFAVTPVLAWWERPHPVGPVDPAEVAIVRRVRVADLVDPGNRVRVRHRSGWIGPAFRTPDLLIWGFTAGVLSVLLEMGGWAQPWDMRQVPVPLT